ncbi:hypothetical protein VIN7_10155 [Saccharomyces cerevisiae x Saccharomyces kudriavzevii VIN7]|uniref:Uncharacterized protein n=1 Tax=Saccharomyces cerevisiae x Saccharomyces kudriavzevii (strain VIN7) TaxID=1095631 RepID=H0H1L0_SACCK|nr:hypothetical protein VIN7_10155 [Saccharomyces cerevisiae x Saccharomyces kudriavzevii VIN7]
MRHLPKIKTKNTKKIDIANKKTSKKKKPEKTPKKTKKTAHQEKVINYDAQSSYIFYLILPMISTFIPLYTLMTRGSSPSKHKDMTRFPPFKRTCMPKKNNKNQIFF